MIDQEKSVSSLFFPRTALFVVLVLALSIAFVSVVSAANGSDVAALLTEKRCASCHSEDFYTEKSKTRLGWEVTIWRMRLAYNFDMEPGDHRQIAAYLSSTYPASPVWRILLWLPVLAVGILVFRRWLSSGKKLS